MMQRVLFALALVAAFAARPVFVFGDVQFAPPTAEQPTVSDVSASAAVLHMVVNARGNFSRSWFVYSKHADLSGGIKTPDDGGGTGHYKTWSIHATLVHLTAGTTYYYRGFVSTSAGEASTTIQSFKTTTEPAKAPVIKYLGVLKLGGIDYAKYEVEAIARSGECYLVWSTDRALTNPQRGAVRPFDAHATSFQLHIPITPKNAAEQPVVYFQLVLTAAGQTVRSAVEQIDLKTVK